MDSKTPEYLVLTYLDQNQTFFIRIWLKTSTSYKFFVFLFFKVLIFSNEVLRTVNMSKKCFFPRFLKLLPSFWNTSTFLDINPLMWERILVISIWVILGFHNVELRGNLENIFFNYLTFIVKKFLLSCKAQVFWFS